MIPEPCNSDSEKENLVYARLSPISRENATLEECNEELHHMGCGGVVEGRYGSFILRFAFHLKKEKQKATYRFSF